MRIGRACFGLVFQIRIHSFIHCVLLVSGGGRLSRRELRFPRILVANGTGTVA